MNKSFGEISPKNNYESSEDNSAENKKGLTRRETLALLGSGSALLAIGGIAKLFEEKGETTEGKPTTKININELEVVEGKNKNTGKKESVEVASDRRKEKKSTSINLEKMGAQELANAILEISNEIFDGEMLSEEDLPRDLINENFLDAIELRESGGLKEDSKGGIENDGAFGKMQVRESAIRDVVEKIHRLITYKDIESHKSIKSTLKLRNLKKTIKFNEEHGRAFGSVYMAMLYKIYGIGKNRYENGDLDGAQKELAAAYNQGPTLLSKNPNFIKTRKARIYYEKPMRHLDFLEDIRAGIESRSFKTDTRELSRQLTLELDRYPDTRTDNGLRRKLMLYYLGEIKKEEDSLGKDLGKNGIAKCIKTLNPRGLTRHANLKLEKKVRI